MKYAFACRWSALASPRTWMCLCAAALWLTGCAAPPTIAPWDARPAGKDFTQRGPFDGLRVTTLADLRDGTCEATVEHITPVSPATTTPFIFAHGLLRGVHEHRDFAAHVASWGVPVYLVGLCSGGWSAGIQEGVARHARLLQQVAERSGAREVVYGGFSAGGNASRRASLADTRAIGYLGLDPVMREGFDELRAASPFPLYALFASPAGCNLNQIGVRIFRDVPRAMALEVEHTTHCHFESPSNWLCRLVCREPTREVDAQAIRARIAAYAVSYVRWRVGLDGPSDTPPGLWSSTQPGVKKLTP
jgi:hypothetical protein